MARALQPVAERPLATAAAGQLGAFANECDALVGAGALSTGDAAGLRRMAERIAASALAVRGADAS